MGDVSIANPVTLPLLPGLPRPAEYMKLAGRAGPDAAEKMAKDFESVLLQKLMDQMQRTVGDSGLLSSGISEQVKGIFWFYLAQDLADKGGMGLWRDIYRHVLARTDENLPAAEVQQTR